MNNFPEAPSLKAGCTGIDSTNIPTSFQAAPINRNSSVMRKCLAASIGVAILSLSLLTDVHATPVEITVTATVTSVDGSFGPAHTIGDTVTGTFDYDTDEANASSAQTTPSTTPGHEFTSFYEFSSPPYAASLSFPDIPGSFSNAAPVGVVVNNDLPLLSADLNGFLPDGNYDWIEILGSTTVDLCPPTGPCSPANGQEWTLAIFGDTGWFADGSVIPDSLPPTFYALIVGIDIDAAGEETGVVFASVDSLQIDGVPQAGLMASEIPEPGTLTLFGLGLVGLGLMRRRNRAV